MVTIELRRQQVRICYSQGNYRGQGAKSQPPCPWFRCWHCWHCWYCWYSIGRQPTQQPTLSNQQSNRQHGGKTSRLFLAAGLRLTAVLGLCGCSQGSSFKQVDCKGGSSEGIRSDGIGPLEQRCTIHGNCGPAWYIIHPVSHNFEWLVDDFLDLSDRGDFHGCCGWEVLAIGWNRRFADGCIIGWIPRGVNPHALGMDVNSQSDRQHVG